VVPLVSPASIVSSCRWYHFLRVLTLRFKFREASDDIYGCVKFFKLIFLQIARTLSLHLSFLCTR